MTDMRATERLLEVIAREAARVITFAGDHSAAWDSAREIELAITELRRRGDTLVRRDDLIEAVEHVTDEWVRGGLDEISVWRQAIGRIEAALGGKPW